MGRAKAFGKAVRSSLEVEHFAGDAMKVIGEACHQLSDFDMLQNQEILAVLGQTFAARPLPKFDPKSRRPKPDARFLAGYHSGNDWTRSKVRKERNAALRFAVIEHMAAQIAAYDGLSAGQVLALVASYLEVHILEIDV